MTEQDYFNDHQEDAERFANFVKIMLLVIAAVITMITIN